MNLDTSPRPATIPLGPTESFTCQAEPRYAVLGGRTLTEAVDDHELWLKTNGEEGEQLVIAGEEGHSAIVGGDVSGRDLSLARMEHVILEIKAAGTQFELAEFGEGAVLAVDTDVSGANFNRATFYANQQHLKATNASFVNAKFRENATLCSGDYIGADFRGACDEMGMRSFANFSPAGFVRENGIVSPGTEKEVESWTMPYGVPGRLDLYKKLYCIQNTACTDPVEGSKEASKPAQPTQSLVLK